MLSQRKTPLKMQYIQLRYQCYQQQLRVMLTALRQFFYFLMMALYLALPALFLSALISLSVIAAKDTEIITRVGYQWGYFLLVYLLIRIQRNAILGHQYRYYLKSLNYSAKFNKTATLLLTLLAGNAPLLAPSLLALLIPNTATLINQFYFVLFAFNVLVIAFIAIKQTSLLWSSLLLFPLLIVIFLQTTTQLNHITLTSMATLLNLLWLVIMLMEHYFSTTLTHHYARIKKWLPLNSGNIEFTGKHYWQFRLIDIKQQAAANIARLGALTLIAMLVILFQHEMKTPANIPIQLIISYFFSLIVASYHFDNERFYKKYRYYLASILMTTKKRYFYDTLAIVLITLFMLMVSILLLNFNWLTLFTLPITTLLTVVAIHYFPRNFFIAPSIFNLGLLVTYFIV